MNRCASHADIAAGTSASRARAAAGGVALGRRQWQQVGWRSAAAVAARRGGVCTLRRGGAFRRYLMAQTHRLTHLIGLRGRGPFSSEGCAFCIAWQRDGLPCAI